MKLDMYGQPVDTPEAINRRTGRKIIKMAADAGFEATFEDLEKLDYSHGGLTLRDLKRVVDARLRREAKRKGLK